jgi:PAS domain S-box-containing protein
MTPILTLITAALYLDPPPGLVGWLGLFLGICALLALLWTGRRYNASFHRGQWALFIILLLITPFASLYLGARFSINPGLPPPGIIAAPAEPVVMFMAAIPWALAAGLLGPLSASVLALLSGLIIAGWHYHNPFYALEMGLIAALLSALLRQRYRTFFYRAARRPLIAAGLMALVFPALHLLVALVTSPGLLVSRLDYALTNLAGIWLAVVSELLIAGLVMQLIQLIAPGAWPVAAPLEPSPSERSLQTRFIVSMAPLALILIVTLMAGDWFVAGRVARDMLEAQMTSAAEVASQGVPYYLETGQTLILQLAADPLLLSNNRLAVENLLAQDIKKAPFFNQLTLLDENAETIASYPTSYYVGKQAPLDELVAVNTALNGLPFQYYNAPPANGQTTAQTSFIAAVFDSQNRARRVLIGRSDLATNPLTQPILASLNRVAGADGQGMLLDENNRILAHPNPKRVMQTFTSQPGRQSAFYDDTAEDGTRVLVAIHPAQGQPWSIVLVVPAYRVQQIALTIAAPLLGMIALLSLIGVLIIRLGLNVITRSLEKLAAEAGRLAEGRLEQPVTINSADEVGQLSRAFEQMRVSLKARLDELNRLLVVSQGVASSLEFSEAIQPVLESALGSGASSARVVLASSMLPDLEWAAATPARFGAGPAQNLYQNLDEQILNLSRQQDRLVLSNTNRPRMLNFIPGAPRPESLMAVALKHENQYYGALWVAYDQPHTFSEEEVRFLVTLGGQAALAAANARLFLNAEIGRKRLESILASTPDPVLVTDENERLLLANPAAWQVLGLGAEAYEGQLLDKVISVRSLVDLLRSENGDGAHEKQMVEVALPGGRVFLASATPVLAEGRRVGRVCVLRDVTHFKEIDALKSEFVSTVSHDLRSPLTLMRGYASMLEMVGQLNEQQIGYVRKIVSGVESMSRLVNNLLDLGRIEAGVGLQLEMVPVVDVVERVVSALQLQASQKRVQLTSELPAHTVPLVEADQALLQQALHNLVENAIKYTKADGKVLVRVQVQPIGVVFQVIDNGSGISPMDMPRLFEKFYRGAQQGSKDERGTGLGLAIVKSIAERHGGRAWAESQLGKGSTFYLALPLKQPKKSA